MKDKLFFEAILEAEKEGKFTKIDNRLLFAIVGGAGITRAGLRTLLTIIRFTLGYHQDEAEISLTTFQKRTELSRPAVIAAIQELISCNMIARVHKGSTDWQATVYRINTDFMTWTMTEVVKPTLPVVVKPTLPVKDKNFTSSSKVAVPSTVPIKKERKPLKKRKKECDACSTTGTINKSNNSQGDIPLKSLSKPDRKRSNNPYIAQLQEYLGYPGKTAVDPVPSPGKEAERIKRMLVRGFLWEQILACWKDKVSQRSGDYVSMVWVNADIGKKGGPGVRRQSSRELPTTYTSPEEMRRQYQQRQSSRQLPDGTQEIWPDTDKD